MSFSKSCHIVIYIFLPWNFQRIPYKVGTWPTASAAKGVVPHVSFTPIFILIQGDQALLDFY